jgi:hypothetical protein
MKKVISLAVLIPYMAFGQIIENFESGTTENWTQSPDARWKADSAGSISGVYSLHHDFDNPGSGTDRAAIETRDLHPSEGLTRWSFTIRHGYDPSSSNNWSVFLISDTEPALMSTDGITCGFAIGVNTNGYDDTLRLYKIKGSNVTSVINCRINWQTDIGMSEAARIIVERSPAGEWNVTVKRMNGELMAHESGTDSELFPAIWFGILYKYTSTKDRLLWFDDLVIDGIFYEDNEAPVITGYRITGKNSLEIIFNEEPSAELMVPENFSLNIPENKPGYIKCLSSLVYYLEFSGSFVNKKSNILIMSKICDLRANCNHNLQLPFTPIWAERADVVISEIMADPLPVVSLPGREYIEITNRTEFTFNLVSWVLKCGNYKALLPGILIAPSEIIILCAVTDTSLYTRYGKTAGLRQFPVLADGGALICLSDSSGHLIHGVEYSADWYRDELKSNGGWSLEMIDKGFPFYFKENWKASRSRSGGTPGSENSVSGINPDYTFYGIQNVFPTDSINIILRFSEPVFNIQGKTNSIMIGNKPVNDLYPTDQLFREYCLSPEVPLLTGETCNIDISDAITDYAGNRIQNGSYVFGLTEPCLSGDILFNELLFNPLPGDPDYLELFNSSEKVIDASRLQIVSVNSTSGDTSQVYAVSVEPTCILPGSYYAFTTDRLKILARYFSADPHYLFETGSLPSMPDDKGHIMLYNMELDIVDEFRYDKEMHYSLIPDAEGVALEKTGPYNKSGDNINWHSASEISGWGTPGAVNSVFKEVQSAEEIVIFSSTKITPDNDGYEDVLMIQINSGGSGNVVSLSVFEESGNFIRKLAENLLIGPEGQVIWDGTAADGSLVNRGIYIILITLFDDRGKINRWKKVCSVIR